MHSPFGRPLAALPIPALATAVLLVGDGGPTGPHLARLSWYLPGYRVSAGGAFIGLLEGGLLGFVGGAALAGLWNAYHRMFVALVVARDPDPLRSKRRHRGGALADDAG